jgi:MYXO-CTERM domain-containing protein
VENHPANPTTKPGSEVTDVPAPGATQETTHPATPAPTATGAPSADNPGTGSGDPDGGNTVAGAFALPLLGLGAFWRRRRLGA